MPIYFNLLDQHCVTDYFEMVAPHRQCVKDVYQLLVICGIEFSTKMGKIIDTHDLSRYGPVEIRKCLKYNLTVTPNPHEDYAKRYSCGSTSTRHLQENLIDKIAWHLQGSYNHTQNYIDSELLLGFHDDADADMMQSFDTNMNDKKRVERMIRRVSKLIDKAISGQNEAQRHALIQWSTRTNYMFYEALSN